MTHKNLIAWLIIGLVLVLSCKKHKDDQPKSPGYFVLTQGGKKSMSDKSQNKIVNVNGFDLGDIKKSKEFNFSLANGGESPIFDITLSFSNSDFTIYPTNISVLNANGNVSLNQLLKVGVIHGLNLDGTGNAPLLSQGINENTLSINGKTLSGNDTINVHLDVVMRVNALVADISMFNNSIPINFNSYSVAGAVLFPDSTMNSGLSQLRMYDYTGPITFTNTGNVPLEISIFNRTDGGPYTPYGFYTILQSGMSTDTLNLPLCQSGSYAYIYGVKINSAGTITDVTKLVYGLDGNIYFALENLCK